MLENVLNAERSAYTFDKAQQNAHLIVSIGEHIVQLQLYIDVFAAVC